MEISIQSLENVARATFFVLDWEYNQTKQLLRRKESIGNYTNYGMNITYSNKRKALAILLTVMMVATCFSISQTKVANAATGKAPYSGGSIKDAVFYIAVDGDADGIAFNAAGVPTEPEDAIYYYTYAEIKAAGEEVAYSYDNHGVAENSNIKGVKLKTLLDATTGITYNPTWTIQYMEDDAYHATSATYQDTIASLSTNGGVNPIIGYSGKVTFAVPDANNVNETTYTSFVDFSREMSFLRIYRQTGSANSTVLKMAKGVVISGNATTYDGNDGYTIQSLDNEGTKIADDYQMLGFIKGMKWEAAPRLGVTWANLSLDQSGNFDGFAKQVIIGDGDYTTAIVKYKYSENQFFSVYKDGLTQTFKQSNIAADSSQLPASNVSGGTTYTYYGWDKPMYVRYQGKSLTNYVSAPAAGEKVYIMTSDGSYIDITNRVSDFFVAYSWTQSKSSTNISNSKRVPMNYEYSVLVDTKSAPIEYSNDGTDYTAASGKTPTTYTNAQIVVVKAATAPTGVKAAVNDYHSLKISWNQTNNALGYQIYRATSATGTYSKIATISSGSTLSYINTNLKPGQKYYYKVTTIGDKGTASDYSAVVSNTPVLGKVAITAVTLSGHNKVMKWASVKGANGYVVYRATSATGTYTAKKIVTTGVKYTVLNLPGTKTYYYKVRAYVTVDGKKVYGAFSTIKAIKI